MKGCFRGWGLFSCVLCLCFAVSAAAQIYKWTDAEGEVHFSDVPPPAGEAAPSRVTEIPVTGRTPMAIGVPTPEPPEPPEVEKPAEGRVPETEDSGDVIPDARMPEQDPEIINGNDYDVRTRWRATSPLNAPGQPIRRIDPGQRRGKGRAAPPVRARPVPRRVR